MEVEVSVYEPGLVVPSANVSIDQRLINYRFSRERIRVTHKNLAVSLAFISARDFLKSYLGESYAHMSRASGSDR
jgi:hypothetical protein